MTPSPEPPPFPPHFGAGRFFNPGAPQLRGFTSLLRWKLTTRPRPSPPFVDDVTPTKPPDRVEGTALRVTLVNHSTLLLQHAGWNILTDPIWSERASPLSWAGPRRHRMPGIRFEDLPPLDAVLLSHNHYDHLDLPTLHRLVAARHPAIIVPVGVGRYLQAKGIADAHELDWGETHMLAATAISCVPAVHFSARGIQDRNRTLWCGYAIDAGHGVIYFAGDTATGAHFAQIRRWCGAPRLSLLPIGAYEPRWFMSAVHMTPEEALRAHATLESRTSIGIHYGTFQLADDGIDEAARELEGHDPPASFRTLRNGEWWEG